MALRFRRSIKLFPGLRINLGKKGASLTVGAPGASINVGSKGTYSNLGIPGTGISVRTKLSGGKEGATAQAESAVSSESATPGGKLAAFGIWVLGGVALTAMLPKDAQGGAVLVWSILVIVGWLRWRKRQAQG